MVGLRLGGTHVQKEKDLQVYQGENLSELIVLVVLPEVRPRY